MIPPRMLLGILEAGFQRHIAKPVDPNTVVAIAKRLCKEYRTIFNSRNAIVASHYPFEESSVDGTKPHLD